jgi:4-cresol dehydrogenase (hydroxylating) flavoprotein subunit
MTSPGFNAALLAFKQLLSSDQIETDADRLTRVETATFATGARVLAVLYPERSQLELCLQIARQHQQTFYTVSSGKNWGYGSQVPVQTDSIILNLNRLKAIRDYDRKRGVVTVEAGVTQAELAQFLREQGDLHWMDCTGSSARCSVVGNTVERGFGHTAYGEHVKHVCGMEVLLANGQIIRTGLHRFPNALAAGVYQAGVGPALDGLFFQSNLGIVLSITLWLMPKPERFLAFYISTEQDDDLEPLVEALVLLKRQGYLTSLPHIANAYRVLPGLQQFPTAAAQEKAFPLSQDRLDKLQKQWQLGCWNVSGALYGTKPQVKLARSVIKKRLGAFKNIKLTFVSDHLLAVIEKNQWLLSKLLRRDMARVLAVLKPVHFMMKGQPSDNFLASAYWRMPALPKAEYELDADGVGLIWCAFVAPADGEHARRIEALIRQIVMPYGFEPGITFTLLSERCLDAVISISYNRQAVEGIDWDRQAAACRLRLYETMLQAGYYPYRLDISMMQFMAGYSAPEYEQLLQRLKCMFDENNLLSPGRYITTREL